MAGAGVPVSMDDRSAIAAAPAIVCPLPEWREVAKNGHGVFLGVLPRPELWELRGVGNAVGRKTQRAAARLICGDTTERRRARGLQLSDVFSRVPADNLYER